MIDPNPFEPIPEMYEAFEREFGKGQQDMNALRPALRAVLTIAARDEAGRNKGSDMTNSELIARAQNIARGLSYNSAKQGPVKHTLHELCHRLGAQTVRVHKKDDGLLLVTCFGQTRFMTFGERVLYRLFGVVPPIDGWK